MFVPSCGTAAILAWLRSLLAARSNLLSIPGHELHRSGAARTVALTALAMLAFAANSVLCRLALGEHFIDPASFAAVRVFTAAATLIPIVLPRWRAHGRSRGNWRSAGVLFAYLVSFSFAYLSLSAGTGALILFGAAQLTMIGSALRDGDSFPPLARAGFVLAVAGLVVLVAPGVTAPNPMGAMLMAIAGLAWGLYSLLGRGAGDPLQVTANNFIYLVPCVIVLGVVFAAGRHLSTEGLALAALSGSLASGLGYVAWYAAQKRLSAITAATVQLSVPVIAALGGLVLMTEQVTLRLVLASCATLGGIAIVFTRRSSRG
jgi:drug/metabolite transporter (DMT)-like permease